MRTLLSKRSYELKMARIQTSDMLTGADPDPDYTKLCMKQHESSSWMSTC